LHPLGHARSLLTAVGQTGNGNSQLTSSGKLRCRDWKTAIDLHNIDIDSPAACGLLPPRVDQLDSGACYVSVLLRSDLFVHEFTHVDFESGRR
jgi:hypothetical protein